MSLKINIILWTLSLFLASFGIMFGIIASYNSRKANNSIRTIISDSWISDESQTLFFKNIKSILFENKKLIKNLQDKLSYYDYHINTTNSRLGVIPSNVIKRLKKSKYNDIIDEYVTSKDMLDRKFKDIIKDYKILESDEVISKIISKKLIKYHQQVTIFCSEILKKYSLVSTKE